MVISSSLIAAVAISAGTFATMYTKRLATITTKSAAQEQANRLADLMARYASQSVDNWATTSYEGENGVVLYSILDHTSSQMASRTGNINYSDPNGNTWLFNTPRYFFYWTDASGGWNNGSNAMPMLCRVVTWPNTGAGTPFVIEPIRQDFVGSDGKSLFPAVTNFGLSFDNAAGQVTISVTAVARQNDGGTARATGAGQRESVTVTRIVNRPR